MWYLEHQLNITLFGTPSTNNFAASKMRFWPTSPISMAVPLVPAEETYTGTITVENANGCVSTGTTFTITVNKCLISIVKESK
jgi:hypothetical protein